MCTHSTVRSWPAMALALFFAGVTARVLLDDVVAGSPFTTTHLGSIAALVAALAAGHMAWPAVRRGAIVSGLILALVAAGATAYVVVAASMRNAETSSAKMAGAAKARDDRRRAEDEWRTIAAELAAIGAARSTQAVRAAMDASVGAREGQVPLATFTATRQCTDITRAASAEACRPLLALRVEMASAIRRAELEPKAAAARARLEALPAAPSAGAGYGHAARVIAALPGVTAAPEAIADRLALLMPVAGVVVGELATIGFGMLALGHRPAAPVAGRRTVRARRPAVTVRQSPGLARGRNADGPEAGGSSGGRSDGTSGTGGSRRAKQECLADLLTEIALGRSVPSQQALADRWGVRKQRVSDWLGEWERSGVIPMRRQSGRTKGIEA